MPISSKEEPIVLILAGGKGERFWPKSRANTPKQLKKVYSNKTLLRETVNRALTITKAERIFIGTNTELKKKILELEPEIIPKANFIIEPEGKNTAPIIALASLYFQEKFGDPVQIVLSADAYIHPLKEFTKTIKLAIEQAANKLVLLGIKPNRPETGYGYISTGKSILNGYEVKGFFEKPDTRTASKYIKKENFYWNPGIFIWKTSIILTEFEKYAPYILTPLLSDKTFKNQKKLKSAFKLLPSEAIDTAIMEKSNNTNMIKATFSWDDVGSWISLERVIPGDEEENHHTGKKTFYFKSKRNISSTQKDLVVFLGVNDLIVVEEDDVLLISSKKSIGDIKSLLANIKQNKSLQKYIV